MNVYQDTLPRRRVESESVKTEDVYQTLHQPPTVKNPNSTHEPVRSSRLMTVLLIFNTLLLIVIVILIGLSTANQLQLAEVNKPESQSAEVNELKASGEDSEREELWRLHDGVFYLFWEAKGNCTEALNFCRDRNSRIATTSNWDRLFMDGYFYHPANPDYVDWILSQANGRKLWVNMDGDTTGHLNETLRQCPLDEENPGNSEDVQGWVCEIRPWRYRRYRGYEDYDDYHFRDIVPKYPTAAPERESSASSAASLLSVKIYIITVSVLASLHPLHF
ncbi:uncharacterized protein LOC118814902 isoform X1 [Colossoma macropomum]|uniref:uncharacterized protein LOC118814902 isoform X1 n=1 Tax=Colossoma macropomum TaxID=42526 RepID=UPI001864F724|nr:uncharacterized protein LOC118814902 isoform X1 [Colossoma macropomum]